MDRNNPIAIEYREAADAVRCGDESAAALDRLARAEAARDEARREERAVEPKAGSGWWNLPVAESCWRDDAKYIERY